MDVRTSIAAVFTDEKVCEDFNKRFEKADVSGNILLAGYKGGVLIGMARHKTNPFKRLGYFSDGKELLEAAIAEADHKAEVELRFLRLTIQTNLPSILSYDENKETDKAFVQKHANSVDSPYFQEQVRTFIDTAEKEGKL